MQRIDLGSNLLKANLAFNVALVDSQRFFAGFKPFQAHRSDGLLHVGRTFRALFSGDFES
jgi:hypothetical protein